MIFHKYVAEKEQVYLRESLMKYEKEKGDLTIPEAAHASVEMQALLKKNGWDETFFVKMQAIMIGYSSLLYQKESASSGDEMAS